MKSIADPLRKTIQDLLGQQREVADEVQAALDAGDTSALRLKIMRLAKVMQRLKDVEEALGAVEGQG